MGDYIRGEVTGDETVIEVTGNDTGGEATGGCRKLLGLQANRLHSTCKVYCKFSWGLKYVPTTGKTSRLSI